MPLECKTPIRGYDRLGNPAYAASNNKHNEERQPMSNPRQVTRRRALKIAAGTAALPLVHIRTAGAAGKLSVGVVDHWVPKSNEMLKQQIEAWGAQNKVEVSVD